jgi:hypothetical protein
LIYRALVNKRLVDAITPTTDSLSTAILVFLGAYLTLSGISHTCFLKGSNEVSIHLKAYTKVDFSFLSGFAQISGVGH